MYFVAPSFGWYKNKQVYLIHLYCNNIDGQQQMPMICKMNTMRLPQHYYAFLKREIPMNCTSDMLIVKAGNNEDDLQNVLNRFKHYCRGKLITQKLRQKSRTRKIKDELVSLVFSPQRIER